MKIILICFFFREAAIELDGKAVFGVINDSNDIGKSNVEYFKDGIFVKEFEYNESFVEICKSETRQSEKNQRQEQD